MLMRKIQHRIPGQGIINDIGIAGNRKERESGNQSQQQRGEPSGKRRDGGLDGGKRFR
jgi:hypothetical protein